MRRLNPKYIRLAGIIIGSFLILVIIAGVFAYLKREAILNREIAKAKIKAKKDYNLDLEIGNAHFVGFSTVSFNNITIVPLNRDSLLNIKAFEVRVKLAPLLVGEVKLADIKLENGHLNLTDINKVRNFDFLFKRKKDTSDDTHTNLAELANNLVNQVLFKIPDNLSLENFLVSVKSDSSSFKMLTQTASIKGGRLTSVINVNDGAATWHFEGEMRPSDNNLDVKWYADGKKVELPFFERRYHLKLNFDTINTKLNKVEHGGGETRIYGTWEARNLVINHPGLSSQDIVIPNMGIDANIFVGENYVSLDSSSTIRIKKIVINPYLKYTLNPVKIYEAKLNTGWLDAQDVFNSFPVGMFDSLDGMKVSGRLNYKLNIFLNAAQPDDVQFYSGLDKDNFRIISYGKSDLTKLNSEFVYTPYEKGKPMPPRYIGAKNPDFTPLENIAPSLRNAVMTAEDPTFYTNHGFVEESIRKSLATDFKNRKFKRGGSTISMQLIKNSFLSREKTLARKVEEILIVWLIENNNLMTKDRMLEVYFNIIEWGRNVYGIGEASRYYFGKTPAELTTGESIYLASIVPKPKAGLYEFLPDGSLRPGLENYFNLIGNLMAGHGKAQRDSSGYGFYSVRLKQSLRRKLSPRDTALADSLAKQEDEDAAPVTQQSGKKPSFFQRLFGKKDTVAKSTPLPPPPPDPKDLIKKHIKQLREDEKKAELQIDTTGKTPKQIRQERRRMRKDEKAQEEDLQPKEPDMGGV
jgi:Transglycosylase